MSKPKTWFIPQEDHLPPLKTISVISFALLLVSLPLFMFTDGVGQYVREYLGLIWHLSMFFFICKLPAPDWGRRAGTFWVLLDVLSGVLYLNNFYGIEADLTLGIATQGAFTLCNTIRLAAHLFEGIWIISTTRTTRNVAVKVCAYLGGGLLVLYTLVSPFAPEWMFSANSPFVLVWLFLIALGK